MAKTLMTSAFIKILLLGCSARPYSDSGPETNDTFRSNNEDHSEAKFSSRTFVKNVDYLWEGAVVPFEILDGFTEAQKDFILQQAQKISAASCVRWIPWTTEPYGVVIQPYPADPGVCICDLGRNATTGVTTMDLGENCFNPATYRGAVLHEMMHALGFIHEHQRTDRDCYVRVDPHYPEDKAIDYKIFEDLFPNFSLDQSYPYDTNSIMHYKTDYVRGKGYPLLRYTGELSQLDIMKLNHLYCGGPTYCQDRPEDCNNLPVIRCPDNQPPQFEMMNNQLNTNQDIYMYPGY